ncbi:MAG: MmcQ/YjbR family DNA-binding protein [Trueperaceae bacterium]|nr:MmcQ/YjbR family DNA-binding protein [Trueperaceae bacterium]
MQTLAELRAYCQTKPSSQEDMPFGPEVLTFKVGGKMYALCQLTENPLRINLKCEPELAELLRAKHPAILPGYHMNKRHWNTLILDGSLTHTTLTELIDLSYELVLAKLSKQERNSLQAN